MRFPLTAGKHVAGSRWRRQGWGPVKWEEPRAIPSGGAGEAQSSGEGTGWRQEVSPVKLALSHMKPRERPPRERATDRRSGGQDPSPGQVQVSRQRRSKGHSDGAVRKGGGGQASQECSEVDRATGRPPQRAGAGTWTPRVTSGVSGRAVSTDLGKCRLGGGPGPKPVCSGPRRSREGVWRERESPSMIHVRKCAGRGSEKWG